MRSRSILGLVHHLPWLGVLPLLAWLGGCVLSVDASGGPACSTSDDCAQTSDPCSVVGCGSSGVCQTTPLPDGLAPRQVPGDCVLLRCVAGATVEEAAPTDADDANPCTVDGCAGATPTHEVLPDGTECAIATLDGSCVAGQCNVPCNQGQVCDDGLPCTADSCDETTKLCVFEPISGPVAGLQGPLGDCLEPVCVAGQVGAQPDDDDLPDDGKPCTVDACVAGAPTFTPLASGTEVSGCGGVCNASGDCVGCVEADDCGPVAPCAVPACVNEVCDPGYLPASTSLADPTAEDCQALACTGSSPQPVVVASPTDLPVDDDPCTADLCNGTTPSNPITAGASCPLGVCNALGDCVECTLDTHCGDCEACDTGTYTCVAVGEGDPGQCSTGQACFGGTCKLAQGQPCSSGGQCGSNRCVDQRCCDAACNAACDACVGSLTGQPDGTCAPVLPGQTAGCTGGEVCCVDGSCGSASSSTCVP